MPREPHRVLDPDLGDRNIFIRIGLTRQEWDRLESLKFESVPTAAEAVLEKILRDHMILVTPKKGGDD